MKIKSLCLLSLLSLIAGCAGYKAQPLKKLALSPTRENKQILFAAKAFDEKDCETYLGRDVIKAGYTPIQIGLKNESSKQWEFSCDEINMPTVSSDYVAPLMYQSIAARALGYGIPSGVCLAPAGVGLSFFASGSFWGYMLGIGLLPFTISCLALGLSFGGAAITDSCWAKQANEQLLQDYLSKSLRDQILLPNKSLDGLIFVGTDDLKSELVVTLTATDENGQEKVECKAVL